MISSRETYVRESDDSNVIQAPDSQTALEWCAVLESLSIEFVLRKVDAPRDFVDAHLASRTSNAKNVDRTSTAWLFEIPSDSFERAEREIRDYESERGFFIQFETDFADSPSPLRLAPAMPIMAFSALLAVFHLITGPVSGNSFWFSAGMLSTAKSEVFQWWRPVTALTLHADAPHVLGNAVFAVFFGGMLAVELGGGAVVALAVASGILGNITSLWLNSDRGYASLGFSTAVFGLLGAMAALRTRSQFSLKEKFTLRFWLPLAAAIALLGMTGAAPGSDLAGHFFGFFWGFVIGWLYAGTAAQRKSAPLQILPACAAVAAVLTAWYAAL